MCQSTSSTPSLNTMFKGYKLLRVNPWQNLMVIDKWTSLICESRGWGKIGDNVGHTLLWAPGGLFLQHTLFQLYNYFCWAAKNNKHTHWQGAFPYLVFSNREIFWKELVLWKLSGFARIKSLFSLMDVTQRLLPCPSKRKPTRTPGKDTSKKGDWGNIWHL